jgi:hypothetical protein
MVLTMMQILRHALVDLTSGPTDHKVLIFAAAVNGFIWLIGRADNWLCSGQRYRTELPIDSFFTRRCRSRGIAAV